MPGRLAATVRPLWRPTPAPGRALKAVPGIIWTGVGGPEPEESGPVKKKKEGLTGKLLQVAGKLITTAAHTAATTGQRAILTFVSTVGGREIPRRTASELAGDLAGYLERGQKGETKIQKCTLELVDGEADRREIRLTEPGMLGQTYRFLFLPRAEGQLVNVTIALEWPPDRFELPEDVSVFIWNDGVQLGPRGAAADYVSMWLADLLGFRFESLELCESRKSRAGLEAPRLFVGRERETQRIVELAARPNPSAQDPWIVSLTALGGTGKSYFLRQVQHRLGRRALFALVDHQSCEGCEHSLERGLVSLLQSLALGFQGDGCSTTRFDKLYTRYQRQGRPETPASGLMHYARKAVEIGSGKNPLLTVAEAGWQAVDAVAGEVQAETDALATNSWVRRLTAALVQDLAAFVAKQRKSYYLWRRPVLVLDSYELLALLADTWLRTVLLANPAFQALRPLVVLASRHELLRVNSRWSEYQGAVEQMSLQPFDPQEAARFLDLLGQSGNESLVELTGGSPLFLSLVARSPSREVAVRTLVERMLEEVEPAWRDLVLDMALPEELDLDRLQRLHPDLPEPRRAFERLLKLTFITAREGRWAYAPAVRKALLAYLELESPQRKSELLARLNAD